MEVILVADFGSSNVRVNAIDIENGEITASYAMKYPLVSTEGGFAEHNAEEEWIDSVICMEHVMRTLGDKVSVKAITFSHIGSSLVPMDDTFRATYNCILGMDSRAGKEGQILAERIGDDLHRIHTSFTCSEISTMAKTLYIKDRMPEVAKKTKYYVSIQQFILKKLGLPMVWDATEAGSHCCYDNMLRDWSEPVLEAVGIKRGDLGSVVNSHDIVGEIRRYGDVEFHAAVPVVIGGHDAVMGTIGLGVGDESEDKIAEVTGTVDVFCFQMNRIFSFSQKEIAGSGRGIVLMTEPGPFKDTTMGMAGVKTAGAVIEWFMREVYGKTSAEAYKDLWSHTVFNTVGRVRVDPDFTGNRGSIQGIDMTTTKYDIFKACIESVTFETRNLLESCVNYKKGGCARVRIGGGHANADEWVQLRADVTGRIYERMSNNEVSSLGAAMLAAYGTGIYRSLKEAINHMVKVRDEFIPNCKTMEKYDCVYQEYIRKKKAGEYLNQERGENR